MQLFCSIGSLIMVGRLTVFFSQAKSASKSLNTGFRTQRQPPQKAMVVNSEICLDLNLCQTAEVSEEIHLGVSKNGGGALKSSILIGCSIIFTIHFGGKIPLFL